jgi:integrase
VPPGALDNPVFCQPGGTYYSWNYAGLRIAKLIRKCGLKGVSLHSLRHTHASELLSRGVPIPAVSKRLVTRSATLTMAIYAHALEADEVAAAKVWNDAGRHYRRLQKATGADVG